MSTSTKLQRAIAKIFLSIIPGVLLLVLFWFKYMRRLLPGVVWLSILGIGFWAGKSSYSFFESEEDKESDWGAVVAACIIGLTVMLFLRGLFSHELIRGLESLSTDDN